MCSVPPSCSVQVCPGGSTSGWSLSTEPSSCAGTKSSSPSSQSSPASGWRTTAPSSSPQACRSCSACWKPARCSWTPLCVCFCCAADVHVSQPVTDVLWIPVYSLTYMDTCYCNGHLVFLNNIHNNYKSHLSFTYLFVFILVKMMRCSNVPVNHRRYWYNNNIIFTCHVAGFPPFSHTNVSF